MKLLVHIHLYYQDQIDFFLQKLQNITIPYDVIFTITDDNEQIRNVIMHKLPFATILVVKNIGYDIYPFILAMQQFDLDKYEYILKLHTKNYRSDSIPINHLHYCGWEWRDDLINSLIGKKCYFRKALRKISDKKNGLVCSGNFIFYKEDVSNREFTKKICADYGMPYRDDCLYCAGTMFLCRADIIRYVVKKRVFSDNDFVQNEYKTAMYGTFSHAMEYMFGAFCQHLGYRIVGVYSGKTFFKCVQMCVKALVHKDLRVYLSERFRHHFYNN